MALGIAGGLYSLVKKHAYAYVLVNSVIVGLIAFQCPAFDKNLWEKIKTTCGIVSPREYLDKNLSIYPMSMWINAHMRNDSIIAILNDTRGFYIDRNYIWGNPACQKYFNYDTIRDEGDLVSRWLEKGVTDVLVERGNIMWPISGGEYVSAFISRAALQVQRGDYLLFNIRQAGNKKPAS
jgi:hypothetical protein